MKREASKSRTVKPEAKVVTPAAAERDSPRKDRDGQKDSSPDQPALEIALEEGWKMDGVDD